MAPPYRPRLMRKDVLALSFKSNKPTLFTETTGRIPPLPPNIRSISWSPLGNMVANCTSVNIRVWNAERPEVKASLELKDGRSAAHSSTVEKIAFNPRMDGLLASTGLDGHVKVWDVRVPTGTVGLFGGAGSNKGTPTPLNGEHKIGDQGLFLTWHPHGTEMLVGRRDDIVKAIDVRRLDMALEVNGNPIRYELTPTDRTPVKDKGNFNMMAFSNSGREVFATTADGGVKILDYPTMQPIHTLTSHNSSAHAVQHSPAGNYLAVGASDSMITLWDTSTWFCSHTLNQCPAGVRDLSFSFDGTYLVVGSGSDAAKDGDKGLAIYHVESGELVHTVDTSLPVTYVVWHPLRYAIAYSGDPGGMKVVGSLTGGEVGNR